MHNIPALTLLRRTYHLIPRVKYLLSKVSNQNAPSEDVVLYLDTRNYSGRGKFKLCEKFMPR
jgi:hypothetical protein